jgi:hypothetical protein
VILVLDQADVCPENWIYIHSPDVVLGRIQNYKNWSPEMVPDASKTALGLEYFVQEDDEVWSASDEDLIELGKRECAQLGLADPDLVVDGTVIRMPKAYPVYDDVYQDALAEIREWLEAEAPNLQLIGRNGQHRYNNQDHSMVTAVYAARNIAAGSAEYDVWDVNVEDEYHEEVLQEERTGAGGDRMVPQRAADASIEELIVDLFARYDAFALGGAVGLISGLGLLLATVLLLLQGGSDPGANLSLLSHYLVGFKASWAGALVGMLEAGAIGFGFGYVLAKLINLVIAAEEQRIILRVEEQAVDLFEGGDQ